MLLSACGGGGGAPAQNQAPSAFLAVNPSTGAAPLLATLDASGSRDSDGQLVSFSWNLGAAGGVVTTTTPTLTVPLSVTFGGGSTSLDVSVTVSDDDGAADTALATVTLERPVLDRIVVDNVPNLGTPNGLGFFQGQPLIAAIRIEDIFEGLSAYRALDATGGEWAQSEGIGGFGLGPLAVGTAAGQPAAAIVNSGGDARFFHQDADEPELWAAIGIDTSDNTATYHPDDELIIIDAAGHPALAYIRKVDSGPDPIVFKRATDPAGDDWPDQVTVVVEADVQHMTAVQVGQLYGVFYEDRASDEMQFVMAVDTAGIEWGEPETVLPDISDVDFLDAGVVDGSVVAVMRDGGQVVFGRRAADGAWTTTVAAANPGDGFSVMRVLEHEGRPLIFVAESSDDQLLLVPALDSAGTRWGQPTILTSGVGEQFSAAIVDGVPVFVHENQGSGTLDFVRLVD